MENSKVIFKKGDVVRAKKEWLAEYETQESTMGIVVDYNEENDYLQVGVLNPQDYVLPPIFNGRGCCYELVKIGGAENALQINKEPEHDFEEICPLCDHVNEYKLSDTKDYKNGKKIVVCQNCGSVIFACNLCDCDGCGKCYIEEGYKF